MKRSLKKIALSYTTLFVFVGASPFIGSPLSRTEAIRIAEAEAQRQKHVDLREYEHWPVFYTAKKAVGTSGTKKGAEVCRLWCPTRPNKEEFISLISPPTLCVVSLLPHRAGRAESCARWTELLLSTSFQGQAMPPARYSDWVCRPLLRKMIGFDQRYSGLSVYSGNDCGVVAGRKGSQQGRFCIVSGSETDRLDGVLL